MQSGKMVGAALGNLLAKQPGLVRRKDTILLIATAVVWVLSTLAPLATDWPVWVSAIIGLVASVAAAIVTAFTKGAITPSIAQRATEEADRLEAVGAFTDKAQEAVSNVHFEVQEAFDDVRGIADQYIGKHRAEETEPGPETSGGGIGAHYVNG